MGLRSKIRDRMPSCRRPCLRGPALGKGRRRREGREREEGGGMEGEKKKNGGRKEKKGRKGEGEKGGKRERNFCAKALQPLPFFFPSFFSR